MQEHGHEIIKRRGACNICATHETRSFIYGDANFDDFFKITAYTAQMRSIAHRENTHALKCSEDQRRKDNFLKNLFLGSLGTIFLFRKQIPLPLSSISDTSNVQQSQI